MVQSTGNEQGQGVREGERRLVTVLFADFVGYTTASEQSDPEVMQEALNLALDGLGADIRRYGGYVDKIVGDQIMGLFGAPRAQDDDAGKAIAAGLAMQARMEYLGPELERRLGKPLRMRVGINTGLVVTGAVGGGTYTVTGDAVNVAARLESAAPHGGVLVGEATRRLARRLYTWGERQELTVKGRTEPVACFTADSASTELLRLVPAPSETPYIGRQPLVDKFALVWDAAREGERVLELVGEAGVGKTRFLTHFLSTLHVTSEQVLYSRADTPPRTFGPLLQLLPALRDDVAPATRARLALLLGDGDDAPTVEHDWFVDALVEILTALSQSHPVALVLDDMHRADTATIEVVEKLLPRIVELPVMTVLLRQPVGRRPRRLPRVESVVMDPLDDDDAKALVNAAAPDLPASTAGEIVSRAGGNPLYLEVLAAAAAANAEGAQIPESLHTAVTARVDELDDASRTVLREASVFGHAFLEEPLKLTSTVTEGFYEALDHLCQVGLLDLASGTGPRAYNFRHSLVQQVLLDGLLRRRRAELHLRAAEALELVRGEGIEIEPEQIAHHFEQAGDATRAASYHLNAAERADRLQASSEARSHRRSANRLIAMASLGELYGQSRPSPPARAAAALLQAALALVMLAPVFLLFAQRGPSTNNQTLGLPTGIIGVNPSSVLIAVALGGVPLLLAGIVFSHVAAPSLMKRRVSWRTMIAWSFAGWAFALASVTLGFGVLVELLRLNALDRLSSMYVGGAMLRLLLGDYSLLASAVGGTLAVAVVWTALLRLHARAWALARQSLPGPRIADEARRWVLGRQLGLLAVITGIVSAAVVCAYQLRLLPNSELQPRMPVASFSVSVGVGVLFAALGGTLWVMADGRLRDSAVRRRFSLIGFEVPLLAAVVFGLVGWYGMRQAVIVSANEVDTPGHLEAYKRVARVFPDLGMAHYLLGERHLSAGEFEASEAALTRAIALDPSFPASYLPRGNVRIRLGDLDGAIADANKLIELRPEHPGGYAIRAWAEIEQGDTAAAAKDFAIATQPLPPEQQSWDAYFVRCLALTMVQQYEQARSDCERVVELNPDQYVALGELAATSLNLDDFDNAVKYADKVLKVEPSNVAMLVTRGTANRQLKNYAEADADFTRAIDADPKSVFAYQGRAVVRLHLDRGDEALADANAGLALDPNELSTRLYVERYTERHQAAIDDATSLIERTPKPPPWLYSSRGQSRLELGQLQEGIVDLDASLRIDPDFSASYDRRGYGYYLLGDYARAAADFAQALQGLADLPPQSRAELAYHRALLFKALGENAHALDELKEAEKQVEIPSVRKQIETLKASIPPTP